jgi:hypothetical protein
MEIAVRLALEDVSDAFELRMRSEAAEIISHFGIDQRHPAHDAGDDFRLVC